MPVALDQPRRRRTFASFRRGADGPQITSNPSQKSVPEHLRLFGRRPVIVKKFRRAATACRKQLNHDLLGTLAEFVDVLIFNRRLDILPDQIVRNIIPQSLYALARSVLAETLWSLSAVEGPPRPPAGRKSLQRSRDSATFLVGRIEACHDNSDRGAQNPRANHPDRMGVRFLHTPSIGSQTRVPKSPPRLFKPGKPRSSYP